MHSRSACLFGRERQCQCVICNHQVEQECLPESSQQKTAGLHIHTQL